MKIKNIDSLEEWRINGKNKIRINLSIETTDDDEVEKICEIFTTKKSCYVFSDRELDEIYCKKRKNLTHEQKIDYFFNKLEEFSTKHSKRK